MSTGDSRLWLTMLQHGDTFFPSGANALSWGLETLHNDGMLRTPQDIDLFLNGQLKYRWALSDSPALARSYLNAQDLATVADCDGEFESLSLARELREGSCRLGGTLLRIHSQLGTPQADAYREMVQAGKAFGHLAIVQGLLWRGVGMSLDAAQTMSAHTLCIGAIGAAIRLGIMGHVDAQKVLAACHHRIAILMQTPAKDELSSFVPASEIAMMRHEVSQHRLFVN